jgi:hypothetical protein
MAAVQRQVRAAERTAVHDDGEPREEDELRGGQRVRGLLEKQRRENARPAREEHEGEGHEYAEPLLTRRASVVRPVQEQALLLTTHQSPCLGPEVCPCNDQGVKRSERPVERQALQQSSTGVHGMSNTRSSQTEMSAGRGSSGSVPGPYALRTSADFSVA